MTSIAGCPPPPPPSFWFRTGLRVAGVCFFVSLFFSLLDRSFATLGANLVYSEAIGLSIYVAYVALRIGRLGGRNRGFSASLWRGVVAVPAGFVVGSAVAAWLLGQKIRWPSFDETSPFALGISAITSVCVMYFFWSRGRLAEAARTEAEARRTTAEARLNLLQAQIEPHMLFNTLANLRSLVDVDPLRAQAMIDQLIVYLRGTLSASRATTTTLAHEFAQLGAYLDLMKVRMASRLTVAFELPPELAGCSVPPMLLQPLVENAIKHGLEPKIAGGTVRVTASSVDHRLQIDVCDDGIGLSAPASADSYGLEHVRERLRTLYGDAASLVVEARPEGGVRARVALPR